MPSLSYIVTPLLKRPILESDYWGSLGLLKSVEARGLVPGFRCVETWRWAMWRGQLPMTLHLSLTSKTLSARIRWHLHVALKTSLPRSWYQLVSFCMWGVRLLRLDANERENKTKGGASNIYRWAPHTSPSVKIPGNKLYVDVSLLYLPGIFVFFNIFSSVTERKMICSWFKALCKESAGSKSCS